MNYHLAPVLGKNTSHDSAMKCYADLVPFLGVALGEHCEVALLDCKAQCIIAIANGHISGRSVGAPMTDLAERIIETREWQTKDYIANYAGASETKKMLRSSTFFIKRDGDLLGMLCINVDTTDYQMISELAMKLGGILPDRDEGILVQENFRDSVNNLAQQVLHEIYGEQIPESFSADERRVILRLMQKRQIFQMKGAVSLVAGVLGCSEPTVYRGLKDCKPTLGL